MKKKQLIWHGDTQDVIRGYPDRIKKSLGLDLSRIQWHLPPIDWKPFPGLGRQAFEIRARDSNGAYRVIYVTLIKDEVHVLNVFKKNTEKTSAKDVEKARQRLKALLRERS